MMMFMYDRGQLSDRNSRKIVKTSVEKKRRDRINKSLDELKDLMALTHEKARFRKLEKAEVLEMTVDYLRHLQQTTHHSLEMYENGYRQCNEEILSLIPSSSNLNPQQRAITKQNCLQIIIHNSCSSTDLSSSPKLWKPYM